MAFRTPKNKLPIKIGIVSVRWYPSSTSCVNTGRRRIKPQQMPPLMVRKPEWRR